MWYNLDKKGVPMTAVREYVTVRDRQISVSLPASFEATEVEVIVLPRMPDEDLSFKHFFNDVVHQ